MSTSENIEFVKKELSNEEKFLETSMKLESFWKKYKILVFIVVIISIVATAIYFANDYLKTKDLIASNEAYSKLLENPEDSNSLEVLKTKNPKLYDVYIFQEAIKNHDIEKLKTISSKNINILSDLSAIENSMISKDIKSINNYTYKDKAILKDYAIVQEVFLLIENKEYEKAKTRLEAISLESQLSMFANHLRHFLLTK
jgi:hypothetical protein